VKLDEGKGASSQHVVVLSLHLINKHNLNLTKLIATKKINVSISVPDPRLLISDLDP